MGFNATFSSISAISWRSVLLVEETGVPGENTTDLLHFMTIAHTLATTFYFSQKYFKTYFSL